MTNGDKEVDGYRAELNERVDDGGGCTETWEALSDKRAKHSPSFGRRTALKSLASIGGIGLLPATALAKPSSSAKKHSKKDIIQEVRRSETYRTVRTELVHNHVIPKLHGATVKETDQGYKVTVPSFSPGNQDATASVGAAFLEDHVTTFADLHTDGTRYVLVSNQEALEQLEDDLFTAKIVEPANLSNSIPAGLASNTETQSSNGNISIQSHLNQYWIIRYGWNYAGTFDEDAVCDLFGGADALFAVAALLADDITTVGVVDDILIPAIGIGAAGCQIEDLAEEYLSGYLNCDSQTWVYEVYQSAWWNPTSDIIVPKCK